MLLPNKLVRDQKVDSWFNMNLLIYKDTLVLNYPLH
jgi:hypothetical protein